MVFCNIKYEQWETIGVKSHNPYFNRWFSAIPTSKKMLKKCICHNPYFNRWFSAISKSANTSSLRRTVTILILIDGFLQYDRTFSIKYLHMCHNPYFNRWFSAIYVQHTNI